MRTLLICLVLSAPISLAGCSGSRRPTIDQLTYFEAVQLVIAEQERCDRIDREVQEAATDDMRRSLTESFMRQAARVERALEVRDAAWKREEKLLAGS